jgi:hypothetical protein
MRAGSIPIGSGDFLARTSRLKLLFNPNAIGAGAMLEKF